MKTKLLRFSRPDFIINSIGYYKTMFCISCTLFISQLMYAQTGGPSGYAFCSNEFQTCVLSGTMDVAYGANGNFVYKTNQTGNCPCNNTNFGSDPAPGVSKKCYTKASVSQNGGPLGYTYAANENTSFALNGYMDIAYGANGSFYYKYKQRGNCDCNSNNFGGDPAPMVSKKCYVRATPSIPGLTLDYEFAANENQVVTVLGNMDIAYGANGNYIVKKGLYKNCPCTSTFFGGDPAYGVSKKCYYKPTSVAPKLPIGMNIHSPNYYDSGLIYTDVMKSCSNWLTFHEGSTWDTQVRDLLPKDINGYPTQLPYNINGNSTMVRFMVNNHYSGRYRVLYDGEGTMVVNGVAGSVVQNGKLYIDFTGQGGDVWINITYSKLGNHVRNIRIIPQSLENSSTYPLFLSQFVDGLRPFHAIRFMDWTHTNHSPQKNWSDRPTPTYFSQSTNKGQCLEYAIELANMLNADAWICVPHMASDDYHRQMARFVRDRLNPNLKIYVEYSNEVWNNIFAQYTWVLNNAPGAVDAYVSSDLAAINPNPADHPEKDAYMMARTFRLFKAEFTGTNASRLIKVAAVQHSWFDNTRRVLEFLKNKNEQCDLVSPAGYFSFDKPSLHNNFLARCPNTTASEILDSVSAIYNDYTGLWTQKNADYARQYKVGFAVYEGGQHMQPHNQQEWCYNEAVWASQIHPKMYDLYMKNFLKHVDPSVNCKLFMAFAYMSPRKSRFGSWGHLEGLSQVGSTNMRTIAPKYQALLDANTPKSGTGRIAMVTQEVEDNVAGDFNSTSVQVYPNPATDILNISGVEPQSSIQLITVDGKILDSFQTNEHTQLNINTSSYTKGLYFLKISTPKQGSSMKSFIVE